MHQVKQVESLACADTRGASKTNQRKSLAEAQGSIQGIRVAGMRRSSSNQTNPGPLRTPRAVILYTTFFLALPYLSSGSGAVAPTIDYSHNMRILKLPLSTPPGSLIYRLRGSDGDPNTQLLFGVSGISGRALLDVVPVARSWNEADVYLRAPLAEAATYNLTVFVSDGNMTTQVESTIYPTDDSQTAAAGSPFLNPRHVFHVPESAKPDEPIGFVTALESEKSDLPVRFELRGKGADKFSIKYVFGPKGQSRADIVLAQPLDYEKQNLFNLKVLALNAWTNTRLDTRNVATMDIVVTVGDLQDTPPVFKNLPQLLRLPNTLQAGDVVAKIEAEDGDYADQRGVNYALDAASPLSNYFDVDKLSGQVKLTKPLAELAMHAAWDSASWSQLTVFASEAPDPSSYDRLWPPMYARADIQLLLVDVLNQPPSFLGGWQTRDAHADLHVLHGYLLESGNQVVWFTNGTETGQPLLDNLTKSLGGRPSLLDLGLGSNGTFELILEGADADNFLLDPNFPVTKQTTFTLSLAPDANRSLFDYDSVGATRRTFTVDIVAKDFGTPQRQSSRIRCVIELADVDDNAPHFEQDLYSFSVYESAQPGQLVGNLRARDPDSGDLGRVRYTALTGQDSQLFNLNPDNGQITLEGHLDRERKPLYLYLAEARDSAGTGKANYTQVLISVLDVNDNAPVFLQSHYDAVLLADGTFHQPLTVRALDADEPGSANSQVAYEIIAGNQNELFAIDSLSGAIYLSGAPMDGSKGSPNQLPQIPPILSEPIVPFGSSPVSGPTPELAGKILPSHEVEETTYPTSARRQNQTSQADHLQQQRYGNQVEPDSSVSYRTTSTAPESLRHKTTSRLPFVPTVDTEQLPALDLLLNLESEQRSQTSGGAIVARSAGPYGTPLSQPSFKVPPVTTLIVRAHDFGIPLRSSTVKVNIYNQALLSRSVSVILNGTAEQLEQRREAIERAFSSITGSKASVESIDALSESSSLSVARVRLAVPQHSLVDLTDLSALMSALDYRSHEQLQQQQWRQPTHYLSGGLSTPANGMLSNITSGPTGNLYNEIHSYAMDANNLLERRLLLYIIIVAVCILALLVIWMVYSCSHENQVKIDKSPSAHPTGTYQATQTSAASNKTYAKSAALDGLAQVNSPIGNNLAKTQQQPTLLQRPSASTVGLSSALNELTPGTSVAKPDHFSMYNGQVWFEPSGSRVSAGRQRKRMHERRASSAPSAASLDSALRSALHSSEWRQVGAPRNASGQFFPNTIGYMENLAALEAGELQRANNQRLGRRHRGRKVAPMPHGGRVNQAFVLEEGARTGPKQASGDGRSGSSRGSSLAESEVLGSDQELLGFDSSGTPIIATHARAPAKPLVIDMLEPAALSGSLASPRYVRGRRASTSATTQTEAAPARVDSVRDDSVRDVRDAQEARDRAPVRDGALVKVEPSARDKPPVRDRPPIKSEPSVRERLAQQPEEEPAERAQLKEAAGKGTLQRQATTEVAPSETRTTGESSDSGSGSTATTAVRAGAPEPEPAPAPGARELRKASSQGDLMSELSARLDGRRQRASVDDGGRARARPEEPAAGSAAAKSTANGSELSTVASSPSDGTPQLRDVRNGELLEKQSIFALTYSGLNSDWRRAD